VPGDGAVRVTKLKQIKIFWMGLGPYIGTINCPITRVENAGSSAFGKKNQVLLCFDVIEVDVVSY
jgi:hypothetical protein